MSKRKPLHKDRGMSIALNVMIVGIAMHVAGVTAYLPLGLIGPDPARAILLLWVMLFWIVGVTAAVAVALRPPFRKLFS